MGRPALPCLLARRTSWATVARGEQYQVAGVGAAARPTTLTMVNARVCFQVALEQELDAVAHCAVLHHSRVLEPHFHLQPLSNLRGHTVQ